MEWTEVLGPAIALLGVTLGGAITLVGQRFHLKRQNEVTRENRLWENGQAQAHKALEGLIRLRRDLPSVVREPDGDEAQRKQCDADLEQLGHAAMLIPDSFVREQLQLAHHVLEWADDIFQWGGIGLWPHQVVYSATREAMDVVSRYLRGEKVTDKLTDKMSKLKEGYEAAVAEKQWQWEEQERMRKQMRKNRRSASSEASASE
jgi:hypothetical protein